VEFFGDTWQWDIDHWTQVADIEPSPRARNAMAFDSIRNRTVLFGAKSGDNILGDTWEFDGDTWTQQESVGPLPRSYPAMVFDAGLPRMLLFGGAGVNGALSDTWAWNGIAWSELTGFGPPPCASAGMVSMGNAILNFGGFDGDATNPRVFGDTWVFDGKLWSERQDFGPGPRWGHAMAFDTVRHQAVVFGGVPVVEADANSASTLLGDTWEHLEEAAALAVQTLTFSPPTALVGQSVTAIVTLNAAAPVGGVAVQLSFLHLGAVFNPTLVLPFATIDVPAGAITAQAIIMRWSKRQPDLCVRRQHAAGNRRFGAPTSTGITFRLSKILLT
jgi:hypothetical protein